MLTTNSPQPVRYSVYLRDELVGSLNQVRDSTTFLFESSYIDDPHRTVLGLYFEDNLHHAIKANVSVPAWFSNLLPEGPYRNWIATDTGVSALREMELLEHVGHDLPGAVRVLRDDREPDALPVDHLEEQTRTVNLETQPWRFSLAGVGLNLSLLEIDDRLTLPASGAGGDWIVKFPSPEFRDVPVNEFATMTLAQRSGINVPEFRLVTRDDLAMVPDQAWRNSETVAYAVRRFDRDASRAPIHIEDLAQVRGFRPDQKYDSSFETVAALCYRGFDKESLLEFVRRVTFNILVSNGDAHLKNWSLIYLDPRSPTLSPAYDLVTNAMYALQRGATPDMGLSFRKSKRYTDARVTGFGGLGKKLGVDPSELVDVALETVDLTLGAWPSVREELAEHPILMNALASSIRSRSASLRVGTGVSVPID